MRARFPQRRRVSGPRRVDKNFTLEPPPELPRTIEVSAWKKALPWVFGIVIVGMVAMMFIMGFRQMNPMYLFFMAMMGIALFSSMQSHGVNTEMSTPEVNSERAEYLRYLSGKAEEIRAAADAQKASAEWSHPDPDVLEAVLDGPRMWERGASDPDYLHIRVGRDEVRLAAKIKVKPVDSELDLEPVTKTALQHMRAVQQSIPHCPKAIDFAGVGMIGVYGDRSAVRGRCARLGRATGVLAHPQRHRPGRGLTAPGVAMGLGEVDAAHRESRHRRSRPCPIPGDLAA